MCLVVCNNIKKTKLYMHFLLLKQDGVKIVLLQEHTVPSLMLHQRGEEKVLISPLSLSGRTSPAVQQTTAWDTVQSL